MKEYLIVEFVTDVETSDRWDEDASIVHLGNVNSCNELNSHLNASCGQVVCLSKMSIGHFHRKIRSTNVLSNNLSILVNGCYVLIIHMISLNNRPLDHLRSSNHLYGPSSSREDENIFRIQVHNWEYFDVNCVRGDDVLALFLCGD